jgi:hypothetical protein
MTLATAMGARVSAIQLLDVEFFGGQNALGIKSSCRGMKIALIGRVAAPFADTVPENAKYSESLRGKKGHQSSP